MSPSVSSVSAGLCFNPREVRPSSYLPDSLRWKPHSSPGCLPGTALSYSPHPRRPGHPSHHPASCCLVREALLQPKLVDTEEEPCGDDPCMRLLLGPHDLRAPNQPPSSATALTGLGQPFPRLFLRKLGDHSPSKAWNRSLCSTLRREGAHRSRGGARSQRADLGAGEMQGRVGWEKKETETNVLTSSSQPLPFHPRLWKGSGRGIPKVSAPIPPPGLASIRTPVFHLLVSRTSLSSLAVISLILRD